MTRCHTTTLPHRTDASHVSAAWKAVPCVTWYTDQGSVPVNRHTRLCCLEGSTPEEREGLSLFIALRWMQDREGVMMWLTENIQAC
ncbi:MAG: hypothetical protein PUC48_03430, partial [Paraprevotella sp.]|nr:hypothetical protein [Paraprevotella sp.]